MSHLAPRIPLSVDDLRAFFLANTGAPSTFGAMLERARDGTLAIAGGASAEALTRAEAGMLRMAAVGRCAAGLAAVRTIRFIPCADVAAIARTTSAAQGALVVGILRAYEPWASHSTEAALAAVWAYLWRVRGGGSGAYPNCVTPTGTVRPLRVVDESLAHAFRHGRARVQRRRAERALADAEAALTVWIAVWNRRGEGSSDVAA